MPHLLQKSFPKQVSKESIRSQERRFRARLCSCPCWAWHDLFFLHWLCPIGSQGHQSGLFCLSGRFRAPGALPKAAVLKWDAPCPMSVPHWGWMGPAGDASVSPLPTMGSFTHVFLPAKLWLRLSAGLCWLNWCKGMKDPLFSWFKQWFYPSVPFSVTAADLSWPFTWSYLFTPYSDLPQEPHDLGTGRVS